jgi:hypothetical protein
MNQPRRRDGCASGFVGVTGKKELPRRRSTDNFRLAAIDALLFRTRNQ